LRLERARPRIRIPECAGGGVIQKCRCPCCRRREGKINLSETARMRRLIEKAEAAGLKFEPINNEPSQPPPAPRAEEQRELDHPCKQTCSGWKQGYERGLADIREPLKARLADAEKRVRELEEKVKDALAGDADLSQMHLREIQALAQLTAAHARIAVLTGALEKIKPLAEFYALPQADGLPLSYPNESCAEEIADIIRDALGDGGD